MVSRVLPGVAGALVISSWTSQSWISTLHGPFFAPETILALASKCVTLFFFSRNSTPLLSLLATSRLRPMTFDQSNSTSPLSFRPQIFPLVELLHQLGV